MKKKLIALGLVTALFCSSILSGCAKAEKEEKKTSTTEGKDKNKVVELTVWSEESGIEFMQKMVDSFCEHYASEATFNITIANVSEGITRDEIFKDVHTTGDVFTFPDDQLQSLVASGVMDPVVNAAKISKENTAESVEAATVNGTLYAYPQTADNGYFMYYDKNYFTQEDVKSLDKILEICAKNGKKFTMDWSSGWYLYSFFGNTGLEMGLNDDGVTNYCNWNTTEGDIKGVDIAQSLLDIAANPGFLNTNGDFPTLAKEGTAIAGVSGVWSVSGIKEVWGDDYGATKLPTYTVAGKQIQMSSYIGFKMVGVNYYSKEKEWAHKFAEWITNEENQTKRFVDRNMGPSNIQASKSEDIKNVHAITAVIEQSQYGTLQRVGNNFWTPFSEFGTTMANGNPERLPLQDLMDKLVSGLTAPVVE